MKPVAVSFRGVSGNAFSLLGTGQRAAAAQGRSAQEIAEVFREATAGDYGHLLRTLECHSVETDDGRSIGDDDGD